MSSTEDVAARRVSTPASPAASCSRTLGSGIRWGRKFVGRIFVVCLALLFGVCILGGIGVGIAKGADIVYGSVYIVANWNDLPPDAQLCKKMFCRRADTTEKHLAGAPGRTSESFGYFCPEHTRSEYLSFFDIERHIGGLLWFICRIVAMAAAAIIWAVVTWTAGAVSVSPVLLRGPSERQERVGHALISVAVVGGIALALTSGVLYWWF